MAQDHHPCRLIRLAAQGVDQALQQRLVRPRPCDRVLRQQLGVAVGRSEEDGRIDQTVAQAHLGRDLEPEEAFTAGGPVRTGVDGKRMGIR